MIHAGSELCDLDLWRELVLAEESLRYVGGYAGRIQPRTFTQNAIAPNVHLSLIYKATIQNISKVLMQCS